jgi:hypothetical protein
MREEFARNTSVRRLKRHFAPGKWLPLSDKSIPKPVRQALEADIAQNIRGELRRKEHLGGDYYSGSQGLKRLSMQQ